MIIIVCLGDSITEGHNLYDNDPAIYSGDDPISSSYEYWLFKKYESLEPTIQVETASNGQYITKLIGVNYTIINAGQGGTSTKYWLDNFTALVLNYTPDYVIFFGNANDPASGAIGGQQTESQTQDNYIAMINLAQTNSIIPIVGTNTPRSQTWANANLTYMTAYDNFDTWLRSYASSNTLQSYDFRILLQDVDGYIIPTYTSDGIHLTIDGYAAMGNCFDNFIVFNNINKLTIQQDDSEKIDLKLYDYDENKFLRIMTSSGIKCLNLVDTSSTTASDLRIMTTDGVKAIEKV